MNLPRRLFHPQCPRHARNDHTAFARCVYLLGIIESTDKMDSQKVKVEFALGAHKEADWLRK